MTKEKQGALVGWEPEVEEIMDWCTHTISQDEFDTKAQEAPERFRYYGPKTMVWTQDGPPHLAVIQILVRQGMVLAERRSDGLVYYTAIKETHNERR